MKSISKITIFDFIVLFSFLLFSIIFVYFLYSNNYVSEKTYFVEVYKDNQLLCKIPISENKELKFQNFVVEIKDNKVRMKSSDCPHKICVHTGWISKLYQQIVCVPNKVYIKISSDKQKSDIDSTTY